MRACAIDQPHVVDGLQCSGPRGKQPKSYPLSDFISLLFPSFPSPPIQSHPPVLATSPSSSPHTTRPLKSAFAACRYLPRHHHIRYSSGHHTRLSSHPSHGLSTFLPQTYPASAPSRPLHEPLARRSSSESPRRARPIPALSHFLRSSWVAHEISPRARPRFLDSDPVR